MAGPRQLALRLRKQALEMLAVVGDDEDRGGDVQDAEQKVQENSFAGGGG